MCMSYALVEVRFVFSTLVTMAACVQVSDIFDAYHFWSINECSLSRFRSPDHHGGWNDPHMGIFNPDAATATDLAKSCCATDLASCATSSREGPSSTEVSAKH